MTKGFLISCFLLIQLFVFGQQFDGTWQGVLIRNGYSIEESTLFYTSFDKENNSISGLSREETYDSPYFSVKKLSGSIENNTLKFKQVVELKSKRSGRSKWCRLSFQVNYNDSSGYLQGDFISTDCKRVIGKVILYKSDFELSTEEEATVSHIWYNQFKSDLKEGLNAPEIRKIERENFMFEPIFFDYDKSDIREEHSAFLNRLIHVVKGHSDLRVKVIGHTDSDGSHEYNDELSKQRAQAITNFFVSKGLSKDRLIIEFKGERNPVDTNSTSEGKQRNRRVDFSFI